MTVYKVDNVYYNEENIKQYIDQNHSFSDFVEAGLKDESGNLRGLLNTMFTVWNGDSQNDIVNYLNVLNYMYVAYVNNIMSKIPKFTVIEGGKGETLSTEEAPPQSEENKDD